MSISNLPLHTEYVPLALLDAKIIDIARAGADYRILVAGSETCTICLLRAASPQAMPGTANVVVTPTMNGIPMPLYEWENLQPADYPRLALWECRLMPECNHQPVQTHPVVSRHSGSTSSTGSGQGHRTARGATNSDRHVPTVPHGLQSPSFVRDERRQRTCSTSIMAPQEEPAYSKPVYMMQPDTLWAPTPKSVQQAHIQTLQQKAEQRTRRASIASPQVSHVPPQSSVGTSNGQWQGGYSTQPIQDMPLQIIQPQQQRQMQPEPTSPGAQRESPRKLTLAERFKGRPIPYARRIKKPSDTAQ